MLNNISGDMYTFMYVIMLIWKEKKLQEHACIPFRLPNCSCVRKLSSVRGKMKIGWK